jgi:BolA protein
MNKEEEIREKLQAVFGAENVQVKNQSHLHAGHAGDDGSGQTHFKVIISKNSVTDISRVDLHKRIYESLGDAFETGLHALQITTK